MARPEGLVGGPDSFTILDVQPLANVLLQTSETLMVLLAALGLNLHNVVVIQLLSVKAILLPEGLHQGIAGGPHIDVLVLDEVRHVIEDVLMAGYNLQVLFKQIYTKQLHTHT